MEIWNSQNQNPLTNHPKICERSTVIWIQLPIDKMRNWYSKIAKRKTKIIGRWINTKTQITCLSSAIVICLGLLIIRRGIFSSNIKIGLTIKIKKINEEIEI
jgi:hypothetical protein